MSDESYRTTVLVEATPDRAYDAVNDVRGWWSQDLDGRTDTIGAEFDYRGNQDGVNLHRARIRVVDLVHAERVEWLVLDNWMSFIDDQAEWTGTRIVFEILPSERGSEIRFSHLGLVPSYECYDACFDAWTFFLQPSLREPITSGRGEPMARLDIPQRAASS